LRPFPLPLLDAVLVRRYKRFLADVRFPGGATATVHCANPGAMTGLATPGLPALVSDSGDPRRKLPLSLELVKPGRSWVCVNTAVANRVVRRWLETGRLLEGVRGAVRPEVRDGDVRWDFGLEGGGILEVKSVTLRQGRAGAFPDAVTVRGRRHLERLAASDAPRRVLVFFVARGDVAFVRPADGIDPDYGRALRAAADAGVEIVAVQARFSRTGVRRGRRLDVVL